MSFLVVIFVLPENIQSQDFMIDMSFGFNDSSFKLDHDEGIVTPEGLISRPGRQYVFGVENTIKGKWRFRTELGFISTFSSIEANYLVNSNEIRIDSWLNNQRLYLGLLPGYDFNFKKQTVFLNAGVMFATDIQNTFENGLSSSFRKPNSVGFGFNTGFMSNYKSIAFRLNVGYSRFTPSEILGEYGPSISYSFGRVLIGVVYRLSSNTTSE